MKIVDREGNIVESNNAQNNILKKLYGTFLGRCALYILTRRFVSNIGGAYMNTKFSTRSINSFIEKNNIDMDDYVEKEYVSYNDFFTRKIKEGKREINKDNNVFISPADSKLTHYKISLEDTFKIKDRLYKIVDLLEDESLANEYIDGDLLIFRLCVDDYHRYSFCDDGVVVKQKRIKGVFHTVNPIANERYPIYARNERDFTVIDSDNFGKVIQMEVGAMMVGRIVNHSVKKCSKGQEKGYFEFGGSTVVVMLKQNVIEVDKDIINNSLNNTETVVKLGMRVGIKKGE